MAHSRILGIALATLTLLGAACTSLIRSTDEYRSLQPSRLQLHARWDEPRPAQSEPVVSILLTREELKSRWEVNYYHTRYDLLNWGIATAWSGLGTGILFLGPGIGGVGVCMITGTLVWFGLSDGFPHFCVDFPVHSRDWSRTREVSSETLHHFSQPVTNQSVRYRSNWDNNERVGRTNPLGSMEVDLRDLAPETLPSSDLTLTFDCEQLTDEVHIPHSYVERVASYEAEAKAAMARALLAEQAGQLAAAAESLSQLVSRYPESRVAGTADSSAKRIRDLIRQKEEQEKQRRQAQAWARLQSVSPNSVQELMSQFSPDESDRLANALGQLSYWSAVAVMREGLGMSGVDATCYQAYRGLSLPQQLYAVVCYKDCKGDAAVEMLCSMLSISEATAERLARIAPSSLTTR